MSRVLLIEPNGGYIRLDRCMQSINSWGGAYRFPLNLSRIAAHLLSVGHQVQFVDLQADKSADLRRTINNYDPDLCILSSGFPSMSTDSGLARQIKSICNNIHVSTFGVVPTLLNEKFFAQETWGFEISFDSIVIGGEPALGYEDLLNLDTRSKNLIISNSIQKVKSIDTKASRYLFEHSLYKSPFTGQNATYIEGTYGCPFRCNFCVVPVLYEGRFSKRTPQDIINEFQFVIENNDVQQVTLWDEGTTFQKSFINELCDGLIELRKSNDERFKNFVWTTRSTTALLDENIAQKMAQSGLSGITLGIESFDEKVIGNVEKNISIESNYRAIELLDKYGIISIGHIILGHLHDTKETIEYTIEKAVESKLNFAQFYCAVPYPGTKLHEVASSLDLIRVKDLTKYELSNPIMDTIGGVSHLEVGKYREEALSKFWSKSRWEKIDQLLTQKGLANSIQKDKLSLWNTQMENSTVASSDTFQSKIMA